MIIVSGIGKVISDPVDNQDNKGKQCRLEVKSKKEDLVVVKLVAFGKSAESLVKDKFVFFTGNVNYIDDKKQGIVVKATVVTSADILSPLTCVATGSTSYFEEEGQYAKFSIGSYDGRTKEYTNVLTLSSNPFRAYISQKRIAASGVVEFSVYKSQKTNQEMMSINLKARDLEITERKQEENKTSKQKSAEDSINYNKLDDLPF